MEYREIAQQEWDELPKDYKTPPTRSIDGNRRMLTMENGITKSVPVKIVN